MTEKEVRDYFLSKIDEERLFFVAIDGSDPNSFYVVDEEGNRFCISVVL